MPVPAPQLGAFDFVPQTKENLDWADLVTLDLSLYGTAEGNKELALVLIRAVREKGFFYIKNFNISAERVNRQFDLGRQFYELPLEEKLKYVPDLDRGYFNGYTPAGRRIIKEGSSKIEIWNMPKFNGHFLQNNPALIEENLTEIEEFSRSIHSEILTPLYVLLALALELPEDTFTNLHKYEDVSEDHLRYMKYNKYSPEENAKLARWTQGHTDLGSFTLLFRQPVCGLQIRDPQVGKWKWVKPVDQTITVNACDALSFLTGQFVRSTIHRVTVPPKDQQHVDRLGLLYNSRPSNHVELATLKQSPVLQREGYTQNPFEKTGNPVPTSEQWTFAKQKWQRTPNRAPTAEILPGYRETVYDEITV